MFIIMFPKKRIAILAEFTLSDASKDHNMLGWQARRPYYPHKTSRVFDTYSHDFPSRNSFTSRSSPLTSDGAALRLSQPALRCAAWRWLVLQICSTLRAVGPWGRFPKSWGYPKIIHFWIFHELIHAAIGEEWYELGIFLAGWISSWKILLQ